MSSTHHFIEAFQRMLPQRITTRIFRILANCSIKPWKNWVIRRFIEKYHVNINDAILQDPNDFKNFNTFFIRHLKPELRPICKDEKAIVSPVDGCIRQLGDIVEGKIFNAKGHSFTLYELLGGDEANNLPFSQGTYTNLYLAPSDYHRVHMPYSGKLERMIYIPGKLFPVKESSVEALPSLFSINERLVLFFDTAIGQMAVIFVGAMIVGNIHVVWHGDIAREKKIRTWNYTDKSIHFNAGDEIGHFKLGSTVIILFTNKEHTVQWQNDLDKLQYGQKIGAILN